MEENEKEEEGICKNWESGRGNNQNGADRHAGASEEHALPERSLGLVYVDGGGVGEEKRWQEDRQEQLGVNGDDGVESDQPTMTPKLKSNSEKGKLGMQRDRRRANMQPKNRMAAIGRIVENSLCVVSSR